MKNSDICVIPHLKSEHTDNTSPNKLFYFMHFKKPVLASNCNYIQEIVEEENCGMIYEHDNINELNENRIINLWSQLFSYIKKNSTPVKHLNLKLIIDCLKVNNQISFDGIKDTLKKV